MLQEQVERVFEKRTLLQEMIEKRRVSLKKLAAKQTRPVQPVAPTPEAIKSPPSSPGSSLTSSFELVPFHASEMSIYISVSCFLSLSLCSSNI